MRLLLISNSTNAGEAYLDYPKMNIKDFLGSNIKKTLFIPYAGVTFSFDEYAQKVQSRFDEIGYTVDSIHKYENPVAAVENAEAIVVGGDGSYQKKSIGWNSFCWLECRKQCCLPYNLHYQRYANRRT